MQKLVLKIILLSLFFLFFKTSVYSSTGKSEIKPVDFTKESRTIFKLYFQDELSESDRAIIFNKIESLLGIDEDGNLDNEKSIKAEILLGKNKNSIKEVCSEEDIINLSGLFYAYFETATLYGEKDKFLKFYENGFFNNRDYYKKGKRYYRILYFYLVNTQEEIISKINDSIKVLNKKNKPEFNNEDIKRLEKIIISSNELMSFIDSSETNETSSGLNFDKVFDLKEKQWIKSTAGWFTSIDNYLAIYSYDWFRENLPMSVSTALVSDLTASNWEKQSILQRKKLPLVFFKDEGNEYSTNIDELFEDTIKYLKFKNRQIDIIVLSALKSWLSKQIKQGVNVEDRLKYKNILEELNVSPSGWIFYNLYECRKRVHTLKDISKNWYLKSSLEKEKIFKSMVQNEYFEGKDNLENIFDELAVIFGNPSVYGNKIKKNSVNYIFHKYKGELNYYYEDIFYKWITDFSKDNVRVPATDLWKDSVKEFRAAFIKEPDRKENHENLLKAYNLYLKELQYNGNILKITELWPDFSDLINKNRLGKVLPSRKNNTYNILHIFADTFLRNTKNSEKALNISIGSFNLADKYYRRAAEKYGFVDGDKTGALNNRCIEIDDYQREFEFLRKIAEKSGKKVQLILNKDKITLYNKLIAHN